MFWARILVLRTVTACPSLPSVIMSASGAILLSSCSNSWMILSTIELEFLLASSPSEIVYPLSVSGAVGERAKLLKAAALSVLIWILGEYG